MTTSPLQTPKEDLNSTIPEDLTGATSLDNDFKGDEGKRLLGREEPFEKDTKIFGLENFGSTCYANSVLQCLIFTPGLVDVFLSNLPPNQEPHQRRLEMPGKKPHHSLAQLPTTAPSTANSASLPNSAPHPPPALAETDRKPSGLFRRTSVYLFGKRPSDEGEKTTSEAISSMNHSTNPFPSTSNSSTAPSIPPISNDVVFSALGRQPLSPSMALQDVRKKMTMKKGPIINIDHSMNNLGIEDTVFTAFKDLVECILENRANRGVVSPLFFFEMLKKGRPEYRTAEHQDAHEFFNWLVNEIIDGFEHGLKISPRPLREIFEGLQTTQIKCLTCERSNVTTQPFLDINIELDRSERLESCVRPQLQSMEIMSGADMYQCDSCYSLQQATRTISVKKLPPILAFHLKRFALTPSGHYGKLSAKMAYPMYLSLEPPTTPEVYYELYGVVVHNGMLSHGHYFSLVNVPGEGWLLFDDSAISKVDDSYVLGFVGGPGYEQDTAYVLFYREITKKQFDAGKVSLDKRLADALEKHQGLKEPVKPSTDNVNSSEVNNSIDFNGFVNQKFKFESIGSGIQSKEELVSPLEKKLSQDNSIASVAQNSSSSSNEREKSNFLSFRSKIRRNSPGSNSTPDLHHFEQPVIPQSRTNSNSSKEDIPPSAPTPVLLTEPPTTYSRWGRKSSKYGGNKMEIATGDNLNEVERGLKAGNSIVEGLFPKESPVAASKEKKKRLSFFGGRR